MLKLTKKANSGFTIVELIIVVVVIAILATITLVVFTGLQSQARTSAAVSSVETTVKALQLYNDEHFTYPAQLSDINITNEPGMTYQYTTTGSTFCVTGTATDVSYYASDSELNAQAGACAGHGANGAAAITNLEVNPSFEAGSTGWGWINGNGYTGAVSSAQSYSGSSSFAITAPSIGGSAYDRYLEEYVDVTTPGTYYLLSHVYLTSSGATFNNRDVWMACASGACTNIGTTSLSYNRSNLNSWQTFQSSVNITGTASIRLRFYAPLGGTTYVDAVMASTTQSGYADGNTAGWIWNGTPNLSTSTGSAQ